MQLSCCSVASMQASGPTEAAAITGCSDLFKSKAKIFRKGTEILNHSENSNGHRMKTTSEVLPFEDVIIQTSYRNYVSINNLFHQAIESKLQDMVNSKIRLF